ncbi:D-isomer specific 2-hydroxyacid dehydrogenase, NAD-binding [Candidatus Sulfopaludibacter sp. SbA3]|nr:D-isomer specific 2-hydroxyacid dehydrogenase, NAD-binding [Candidatus Sulfopaludibacter sp. SbA3]
MDNNTILVLANPTEPQLAMLEELPPETGLAVGNSPEAFARTAADANVLFNWSGSRALLREVFAMCPSLEWVHARSAGLDSVLFPELVEHPVPLTNGSGVFSPSLGEFVLGAILYFAKDFRRMVRHQQAGQWEPFDITLISGQTAGIIGYGDIGRACATRMKAMGLRVLAVKRSGPPLYNADPLVEQIYAPDRRIEMIQRCDYIVVAAPLTGQTRGMLGPAEFAAMKPSAVVINVGRGPVIDEAAMVQALSQGLIKGAALDVFDQEPLPAGHPFYGLENVLLSAHCADHTPDWMDLAMRFFLDQFARFRKGEPLLNVVNKQLGY